MKEILCVDIGGSKYMVGVITPEGKILYSRKVLLERRGRESRKDFGKYHSNGG